VERPKTGHRHEAGSVTVVDLIRRQHGPVRIPSADELSTTEFVGDLLGDDLLGPAPEPDRRGWLARSAKLAGLGVGSLVLCGSVVLASTLTHDRHEPVIAPPPAPSLLVGADALRPDALAAQLAGTHTSPIPLPTTVPAPHSRVAVAHPRTVAATGTTPAPTTEPAVSSPVTTEPLDGPPTAVDVVRSFFRLVATQPTAATQLVDPTLLEADPLGFARSWSSMTKITVDSVTVNPDDSVQAVVRMLEPDGTWLRVVELLHVTGGDDPVIDGAQLLSAQHG
jgi:hypothetical protein